MNPAFLSGQIDANRTYLEEIRIHLNIVHEYLEKYKTLNSRFPTTDEGLSVLWPFISSISEKSVRNPSSTGNASNAGSSIFESESTRFNILNKIDKTTLSRELLFNRRLTVTPLNIHSIFGVPLILENRNSIPSSSMNFSPVEKDFDKKYSIQLEKNVYLYSTAGSLLQSQIDHFTAILENNHRKANIITASSTAAIMILLILFFRAPKSEGGKLAKFFRYSFRFLAVTITVMICAGTSIQQLIPSGFAPSVHSRRETLAELKPILNKYQELKLLSKSRFEEIQNEMMAMENIIQN
jgi:hypothetical protein